MWCGVELCIVCVCMCVSVCVFGVSLSLCGCLCVSLSPPFTIVSTRSAATAVHDFHFQGPLRVLKWFLRHPLVRGIPVVATNCASSKSGDADGLFVIIRKTLAPATSQIKMAYATGLTYAFSGGAFSIGRALVSAVTYRDWMHSATETIVRSATMPDTGPVDLSTVKDPPNKKDNSVMYMLGKNIGSPSVHVRIQCSAGAFAHGKPNIAVPYDEQNPFLAYDLSVLLDHAKP